MAEEDITTRFRVDVSDLKRGINDANQQIRLANAQFKVASAGMDDWANSIDGVEAKLNQLRSILTSQNSKLRNYEEQLKRQEEAFNENGRRADELREKMQLLASQGVERTSEEYKNYQKELNKVDKEQIANKKSIDELQITILNQKAALNQTEKEIRNYSNELKDTDKSQKIVNDSLDKMNDGFTVTKGVIADLVADGIRNLITGLKDMAIATFNAGVEFESAFAGVKKTVDATEKEYKDLEKQIINMSKTLPASASEIAKVAEVAGQLGISKENILEFSKVMIDLGESTNLSSEEAATALARLSGIMGTSSEDYNRLGSVIVDLGNNYATTESEIVDMALRLAGAGKTIGLSEANVLSISAALSSVGIEAEMGGSAMSKAMSDMALAAETGSGKFADLETYAKVAGMSTKEFGDKMKKDAVGAITDFIIGLGKVDDSGGSTLTVLQELGFEEIRLRDTILRSANASDIFTGAIQKGNEAWMENTALTEEAGKRYETTESKIEMMKNQIKAVGIDIFEKFQVPIRKAIGKVSEIFKDLQKEVGNGKLNTSIKKIADAFGKFIEKASEFVSKWLTKLINGLADLIDNWDKIKPVIEGATVAILAFKTGMFATNAILGVIKTSMATYTALQTAFNILTGKTTVALAKQTIATAAQAVANGTATASQIALNTAMSANPIGLVIAGLALLAGAVMFFKSKADESVSSTELENQKLKEQSEEIQKNIDARNELVDAKDASIQAGLAEFDNNQRLANELKTIVDENGKVKKGYEDRVKFILNELNEAYGLEYKLIDGTIEKYQDLVGSIELVMRKKQAKIILDANEELYKKAIENQTAAYQELAKAEENEIQKKKELQDSQRELNDLLDEHGLTMEDYETNSLDYLNTITKIPISELTALTSAEQQYRNAGETAKNATKVVGEQKDLVNKYYDDMSHYQYLYTLGTSDNIDDLMELNNQVSRSYSTTEGEVAVSLTDQLDQLRFYRDKAKEVLEDDSKNRTDAQKKNNQSQLESRQAELDSFAKYLGSLTSTTEENSPELIEAWRYMSETSTDEFNKYMTTIDPTMKKVLLEMIGGIDKASPEVKTALLNLATNAETSYEKEISKMTPAMKEEMEELMDSLEDDDPLLAAIAQNLGLTTANNLDQADAAETSAKHMILKYTGGIKDDTPATGAAEETGTNTAKKLDQSPEAEKSADNILNKYGTKIGLDGFVVKQAENKGLETAGKLNQSPFAESSADEMMNKYGMKFVTDRTPVENAEAKGKETAKALDQSPTAEQSAKNELSSYSSKIGNDKNSKTNAEKVGKDAAKAFNQSSEASSAGQFLLDGLKNGISNVNSQIYRNLIAQTKSMAKRVLAAMREAFNINSPSKETETMGKYLIEGLADGLKRNVNIALKSAGLISNEVLDAFDFNSSLGNLQTTLANDMNVAKSSLNNSLNLGREVQGTNKIVNFTQNNYSPKPLSRLEIYRQSKNAVSVLGEV